MTKEMKMLFAMYYEECFDFYRDVRNDEDDASVLYDKGAMNAIKHAILRLSDIIDRTDTERTLVEVKDAAKRDEAAGHKADDSCIENFAQAMFDVEAMTK